MNVQMLNEPDAAQHLRLVAERGGVFYSAAWGLVAGSGLHHYGVFEDSGELVGAFLLYEERRMGVSVFRNPPFTPVCGPICQTKGRHGVKILEERRKVVDAMAGFLGRQRFGVVSVALDYDVQDVLPFLWRGFKVVPRYTYVIDLNRSLEEIASGFSPTRRNDISKARRDGLVVRDVSDPAVVSALVQKTLARQRARPHAAEIDRMLRQFACPANSYALAAYRGSTPIACMFAVHDQKTAYYVLGGYDAEAKHHGAGAIVIQEAIQRAKEKGLKTFDFEGSTIPQIERFFRGFGGRLVPYFCVNRAWLPFEIALKFLMRNQF